MTAALKQEFVSIEDYLVGEEDTVVKHEYIDGAVYAMAGARMRHNLIKGTIFGELFVRLRGKTCQPLDSDNKIRVTMADHTRFYYPDVSVVCRKSSSNPAFQDKPVVIFEVLSKKTRRIDEGEKKDGYLSIPSLKVYVLVEQDAPLVVAFRRKRGKFVREHLEGLDAVLTLDEIGTDLPLSEIYGGIDIEDQESADRNGSS